MTTFLLTIGFFAFCMAAMAIGVIVSDRRLHGSCGGPDSDDCVCEIEKRQACAAQKRMLERLAALRATDELSACTD